MPKLIAAASLRSRRFIRRCYSSGVSVISAMSCCQISVLKRGRNRGEDVAHHLTPLAWEKFSSVAELLGMVFVLAIEETKDPTRLSHVCQRWRDVAIATPMLWTDIRLCLSHVKGKEDMARFSAHLSCWLERSSTCPISIRFHRGDYLVPLDDMDPFIASLIELLMLHTQRWREVYFDVGPLPNTRPFLQNLGSSTFPILERLELIYSKSSRGFPWNWNGVQLKLTSLSRLSNLTLQADAGPNMHWLYLPSSLTKIEIVNAFVLFPPTTTVPCLRSLSLHAIPTLSKVFPGISRIFPCLEELEIYSEAFQDAFGLDLTDVLVFPSLTKLGLLRDTMHLLRLMCAPRLTRLRLEDGLKPWNDEHVSDFLRRSRCQESLVHIHLSAQQPLSESNFIDIFKAAPNLEVIQTYDVRITNSLLVALTISPQQRGTGHGISDSSTRETVLCPKLKKILFSSEQDADPISVDVAISLILSRCHYQDIINNTDTAEDRPARRPSLQRIQLPMIKEDIAKIKDDPRVQKASLDVGLWCGHEDDEMP